MVFLIKVVSHRSVFLKLTLTDRKMQAKICLKVVLTSLDYGIWVSETSFLKKWHILASTASNSKSANILHDFSWFYQKKICSKDQNKAESKNLGNFDVLSSDFEALKTPAASLTSAASLASATSATSTTLFTQRISWFWWFDHICHQNDQYWPLFVELIAKNPNFY